MAVVFTFAAGAVSPPARAGTYTVSVCGTGDGSAGTADGLTAVSKSGSGFMDTVDYCSLASPALVQHAYIPNSSYSGWTWNGDGAWTLSAPANTSISALTLHQTFSGFESFFTYDLTTPDFRLLERAQVWRNPVIPNSTQTFVINAPSVTGRFYCAASSCSGSTDTSVVTDRVDPTIEDDHAPTFDSAPTGSLLSGGSVSGTRGVAFSASDLGGGIYSASLLIDGTAVKTAQPDTNGGRCVRPFTMLVPCQLQVSGSISIDTTTLREGEHQAQVAITDVAGNTAVSAPTTITVDNVALPSGGVPSIEGAATVGTTLIAMPGVWDGASGGYAFQWQRCDASGGGCAAVATGSAYALTLADVGSRLRVRVVASNSAGEQASAISALSDVVQEQSGGATGASENPGQRPAAGATAPTSPPPSANGKNASVDVRLEASFGAGRRLLVTSAGKHGLRIVGRLLNADDGLPIAGASLEQTVTTADGRVKSGRTLTTNASGTFTLVLPSNPVSETLTLRYRSHTGAAVVASVTLRLHVRARIAWRASSAGHVLTFTGRISRPVPGRPRQYVEVQWHRGGGWATLAHPIAVARSGRFSLRYAVGSNVTAGQRFQFRVSIRETSARYPYDATTTPARWVTVR